jgi:NADPH:quinone reductase-like Zn-dependent oxidoreductase
MEKMKAIVCTAYGTPDVLQLQEVAKPTPRDNEVLIKIEAATVTLGDCELRSLTLPLWTRIPLRLIMGYRKPKNFIPGMELSGVIESVGKKVTAFKKGDAVFASSGLGMGANAEYKCLSATGAIAIKPASVTFEEAATLIVGGLNALHFLRKANIQPGQKVLINGAGGSIGTYAVQLAKFQGAEVTAVDSTVKLDMLRSIGADQVIDYTKESFTQSGKKYDVIFDVVYSSSFEQCIDALTPTGVYLMANPSPRKMLKSIWVSRNSQRKVIFAFAGESVEDLNYLAELIATGKIKTTIDKRFTLAQTAEAHRYVDAGLKKGNLIINVTSQTL